MSIKKIVVSFIFIFYPIFSIAENSKFLLNFENKEIQEKYQHILVETINFINKKDIIKEKKINIFFSLDKKKTQDSFLKFRPNTCIIKLNFRNEIPVFFNDFSDEIRFVLLHEIGHCVLGEDILKANQINWEFNVEEYKKAKINEILSKNKIKTQPNCLNCHIKRNFHPLLAYHEIFSDLLAFSFFQENNYDLSELLSFYNYRLKNFNKQQGKTNYISHFGMEKMLSLSNPHEINIHQIKIISQEVLLEYINFNN